MSSSAAPRRCLICGSEPRRSFRLSNAAPLLRCPRCALGWWPWPAFDPKLFYNRQYFQSADLKRGYSDYASLEPGLRHMARSRLLRIGKLLQARPANTAPGAVSAPRAFDIGCGTGCFLEEAGRAGWEAEGCEVSAHAAEQARARGLAVTCTPVEQLDLPPNSYDCVALWDVVEHLRDPRDALAKAAGALRPGGVLALSTGDITSLCARLSGPCWHLFNLPEHLFFFSPNSLRRLLARVGCRVRRITREVSWVPLAYVLERLGKSLGGRGRLVNLPRAANRVVPATLFDVLGVYATRGTTTRRQSPCTVAEHRL
jgi:SAM-dependent methyltransferase